MLEALFSSIFAFISTNIDDILILTFIFTANKNVKMHRIILGKYLGMMVLVSFSLLSAFGLKLLDERILPFLGIVPFLLGIKEIIGNFKNKDDENTGKNDGGILSTAFITIASGADNLGVYIPLFTGFNGYETLTALIIFAFMTFIWCLLGKALASLKKLQNLIDKYKAYLIPAVYFILGIYIFLK